MTLNSTKVGHHRIEDKPCEEEKKKITSDSKRVTSNSSSSSSTSPSSTSIRRGRSRSRRAFPPTSPLILSSSSWWSIDEDQFLIWKKKKKMRQNENLIFWSFFSWGLIMPTSSRDMQQIHLNRCMLLLASYEMSMQHYHSRHSWPRLVCFS